MPHAGGRVGCGIYLADCLAKSAAYVQSAGGRAVVFLVEAALGAQHVVEQDGADVSELVKPPAGCNSVLARGQLAPDPAEDATLTLGGHAVAVPQGAPKPSGASGSSFVHNEFLIYKASPRAAANRGRAGARRGAPSACVSRAGGVRVCVAHPSPPRARARAGVAAPHPLRVDVQVGLTHRRRCHRRMPRGALGRAAPVCTLCRIVRAATPSCARAVGLGAAGTAAGAALAPLSAARCCAASAFCLRRGEAARACALPLAAVDRARGGARLHDVLLNCTNMTTTHTCHLAVGRPLSDG